MCVHWINLNEPIENLLTNFSIPVSLSRNHKSVDSHWFHIRQDLLLWALRLSLLLRAGIVSTVFFSPFNFSWAPIFRLFRSFTYTFVPHISWFVILIHFYCANESKDIAMHCCGGKGKKYTQKKIDSKPRMVHSLSSVGEISKGRQLRGNKSGLKKKKNRKKNQPTK